MNMGKRAFFYAAGNVDGSFLVGLLWRAHSMRVSRAISAA